MPPFEVVIAGGGVAALEAALALRDLAGDRVNLTFLAPTVDFVYRPVSVLQPFVDRAPRRLPLGKLAAELHATHEQDAVASVDCERRVLRTRDGRELRYDALLVAVGARARDADANTIDVSRMDESLHGLLEQVDTSGLESVAFAIPQPTWPLPAYEVALLVRERARERRLDLRIAIVTAEDRPLAVFGESVSGELERLLTGAEIELTTGAEVSQSEGQLIVHPGGWQLQAQRLVAVPRLGGPAISGLPTNADGFLPVSPAGEVSGVDRVYGAGDATDFPVKFGGIAAQQADAAASSIAALAGAPTDPIPFDGVVHGALIAGRKGPSLYFNARIEGGVPRESRVSDRPTSSPAAKITAHYLGPYLDDLWAAGPRWVAGQVSWQERLAKLRARAQG